MSEYEVVLRPAKSSDATGMADVWLRSFGAALPTVRRVHSDKQVRQWIHDVLLPTHDAWVADADGTIVGLMAVADGWIDQLYIHPEWQGRGIGTRFLEVAKSRQPTGLQLWTFQVNEAARMFYERHSFVPVEWTDGEGNEEQEPDVRYVWNPDA